ncbi:MAG: hypothetical protein U9Q83_09780, partial [Bacteroidota bacterium]|nr:hypothetical protein [Bacteroidota bacterium]
MKKIFLYFVLILISSCNYAQKNDANKNAIAQDSVVVDVDSLDIYEKIKVIDTAKCGLNFKKGSNYYESKSKIINIRNKLGNEYSKLQDSTEKYSFLDSVSFVFSDMLLNEIMPYWYGTDYDFSG